MSDVKEVQRCMEIAMRCIRQFAIEVDYPEIAALPVHIYKPSQHYAPAYTTNNGIFIREDRLLEEPGNIPAYLCHEIFHHVVHDGQHAGNYPAVLVFRAEDYQINWHMWRLFDMDVRKMGVRGLFNPRLGRMRIDHVCKEILRKNKQQLPEKGCWCNGTSHPLIMQVALHLRHKYHIRDNQALYETDASDDQVFLNQMGLLRRCIKTPMLPVDLHELTKGMWMSMFNDTVTPMNLKPGKLSLTQSLVYTWNYNTAHGNLQKANLATAVYITTLADHRIILLDKYMAWDRTCHSYKNRLFKLMSREIEPRWKRGKKIPKKLWDEKERLETLILDKEARMRKLHDLLNLKPNYLVHFHMHKPIVLRAGVKQPMVTLKQWTKRVPRKTNDLNLLRGDISPWIAWLSRIANERLKRLIDLQDMFKQSLDQLLGEKPPKQKTSKLIDTREEQEEPDEDEVMEHPGTPIPDEEAEDEESLAGGKGHGTEKPIEGIEEPRVRTLLSLSQHDMDSLENIMTLMTEFESSLSVRRSKDLNELSNDPTTVPNFGNDLNRVEASEFAMLSSPEMRLLFLAKLADNGLSIQTPVITKRNSVVICIDCSGSMRPTRYEMACGFALAMMKKLHADGRGSALIIFHHTVVVRIVVNEREPMQLFEIIEALLSSESGGTTFDDPLLNAYAIKQDQKWKSMTTIFVTDGQGDVSEGAVNTISALKTKDDNLTLGLIGGSSASGFHGLEDGVFKLTKQDMKLKLVAIGNAIL